ncbi:hypothetical protein JOQ06_000815 [Pogonophryne albipinna]|uniref:Uncharacterized protein n=1 Tax=Pogonophryne albipinna TaxID=1090488 RepID=A0AAD6B3H0_9TELE|nr:hypothetical protein JOQ06_000815 [Pogonophryne albipinna]
MKTNTTVKFVWQGNDEAWIGLDREHKTPHSQRSWMLTVVASSHSVDRDLSDCPARDKASDDLPTPFCPRSTILNAPLWLLNADWATADWLKDSSRGTAVSLMGNVTGASLPGIQSQSSDTASSLRSWCLRGAVVVSASSARFRSSVRGAYPASLTAAGADGAQKRRSTSRLIKCQEDIAGALHYVRGSQRRQMTEISALIRNQDGIDERSRRPRGNTPVCQ